MAPGHNERELKMKISHRFAVVAIGAFFIASCGGGSSSGSVSLTATDVSTGLNVNPNGFSFANFTATSSPEVFVRHQLSLKSAEG